MYKQQEWGQKTGLGENVRRFDLRDKEVYPERPGLPDCVYYMRNGSCGYGAKCRFNHPRDRGSSLVGGEYPERLGEPACEYYLRTGTCKFGASCKFSHPKNAGGSLTNAPLNINGYPLRPGEKECSYYLKTGQCKYNLTCKFDHPQPASTSVPAFARPFYPTVHPLSSPSHDQYDGNMRPPLLPGSYVSGAYGPMLLHHGMVPVTNWNPYSGPVSPSPGAASVYGPPQLGSTAPGSTGAYPQLPSSTGLPSSISKQQKFPERPGQPNCKYYMRNGDCKYGSSCRYNHPPEWVLSTSSCALSSMGLPLRPGVQACSFYLQNGHCKFGRTCKFDHALETVKYSKASYYAEIPG